MQFKFSWFYITTISLIHGLVKNLSTVYTFFKIILTIFFISYIYLCPTFDSYFESNLGVLSPHNYVPPTALNDTVAALSDRSYWLRMCYLI